MNGRYYGIAVSHSFATHLEPEQAWETALHLSIGAWTHNNVASSMSHLGPFFKSAREIPKAATQGNF
jgi:hypothetical protein